VSELSESREHTGSGTICPLPASFPLSSLRRLSGLVP
jgi:hypothetical protein